MAGFVGNWGKQWFLAGGVVVSAVAVANVGIAKFLQHLVSADDELTAFVDETGLLRDEAYQTKSALDAMGKSLDEIKADPELLEQFKELKATAAEIQPPDMSEGLNQVRGIISEFEKMKMLGGAAIQWIGHYLLKYIKGPLEQVKSKLGGVNEVIVKNLPSWSEKIGMALSWIVRLGLTLIRGAGQVYNAIKRIFDMIPRNIKLAMAALAAFGMFIRAGPIGKLITIFSIVLLLLEDFFTYLDGGEALLGGLWQSLIDIWNLLKDSGVLDKLKETARKAFEFLSDKIVEAGQYLLELYDKFKNSGAIDNFLKLLGNLKNFIVELAKPILNLGEKLLAAFTGGGKTALEWFISDGLPKLIGFVSDAVGFAAKLIGKLNDMGLAEPIIIGIASAFAGLKIVDGITESVNRLNGFIKGISEAEKAVGHLKGLKDAFGAVRTSLSLLYKAKIKDKAETLYLMALYAKDAVVKGASTAATIAHTAATTAWNVVAGIGAAVTTAFGAAVAFLTSPIGLVILAIVALIAIVVLLVKNWDKVKEFFIALWAKIKEVFSNIGAWFAEKFNQAKEAVINAFHTIGAWFAARAQDIRDAFANIGQWFSDKFNQAKDFIVGIFGAIGAWFVARAQDIVSAFANLPANIRTKFAQAAENAKKIFFALPKTLFTVGKNIIKAIWDGIFSMASWLKDKVTGFFSGIWNGVKSVFGAEAESAATEAYSGGTSNGSAAMPGHADGGVFDQEHVARFAEDNKPEAVIPLSKPTRAREVLGQVENYLGGGSFMEFATKANSFMERATSLLEQISNIVTGGASRAAVSNATASTINNNQNYDMKSTFNIYDSSGQPQTTAKVVDRQQQLRIRNMQGVIV